MTLHFCFECMKIGVSTSWLGSKHHIGSHASLTEKFITNGLEPASHCISCHRVAYFFGDHIPKSGWVFRGKQNRVGDQNWSPHAAALTHDASVVVTLSNSVLFSRHDSGSLQLGRNFSAALAAAC